MTDPSIVLTPVGHDPWDGQDPISDPRDMRLQAGVPFKPGYPAGMAYVAGEPTHSPTSEVNRLPGEAALEPYNPSVQESIKATAQDALQAGGMPQGRAQDYSQRVADAAYFIPGVGNVIAGNNAYRAAEAGRYGAAALDAVGAMPIPANALAKGAMGLIDRLPAKAAETIADKAAVGSAEAAASSDLASKYLPDAAPAGFTAYHGTPHDFDQFRWDPGVRGTGEGAQAYGDGLYFAGNEGVAESYRNMLPAYHVPESSRVPLQEWALANGAKPGEAEPTIDAAIAGDRLAAKDLLSRYPPKGLIQPMKGHMYEVGINADPEHFLDWDKPLGEQHPSVQQFAMDKIKPINTGDAAYAKLHQRLVDQGHPEHKVRGVLSDFRETTNAGRPPSEVDAQNYFEDLQPIVRAAQMHGSGVMHDIAMQNRNALLGTTDLQGMTGRDLHDRLSGSLLGTQAAAAEAMKEAGIPGIRFLDGSSRSKGAGSHNYVVFDPATIAIIRKYGFAGLGIGAAAGGALTMQPGEAQAGQMKLSPVDGDPFGDMH